MLTLELIIVEPDFRWTLDASIIGSNPGGTKNFSQKDKTRKTFYKEKKMPKNFSQIREEAKKMFHKKRRKTFVQALGCDLVPLMSVLTPQCSCLRYFSSISS